MAELRSARSEDREEIRRIDVATWSPRVTPGPPPDGERDLLDRFGAENVIVAEAGEGLAGYLILGDWTDLDSTRHVGEVKGLAVDPARQGEGVGGALLDAGIERARAAGSAAAAPARPRRQRRGEAAVREPRLRGRGRPAGVVPARGRLRRRRLHGPRPDPVTGVGIDVGGRRKGFHGCAVRGAEVVAGRSDSRTWRPRSLGSRPRADDRRLDSPRSCAPPAPPRAPTSARSRARSAASAGRRSARGSPATPTTSGSSTGSSSTRRSRPRASHPSRLVETFPTAAWTIWAGRAGQRSAGRVVGRRARRPRPRRPARPAPLPGRSRRGRRRPRRPPPRRRRHHAYGEIVTPAARPDGRPAAPPRRARTSPAPPAAARCRPATDRPG